MPPSRHVPALPRPTRGAFRPPSTGGAGELVAPVRTPSDGGDGGEESTAFRSAPPPAGNAPPLIAGIDSLTDREWPGFTQQGW
jgi:hypothetical protein